MDDLTAQIMDNNKWPSLQLPENLDLLNELADNSFLLGSFEGKLAGTLMYHQILEAMCMHLLDDRIVQVLYFICVVGRVKIGLIFYTCFKKSLYF